MKKLISVLLCINLLFGLVTISASAATNYTEKFQGAINMLRWRLPADGNQSFGSDFPAETLVEYTFFMTDEDKYGQDKVEGDGYSYYEKIIIPSADFEGLARKLFAKIDTAGMRTIERDFYDSKDEANCGVQPVYHAATDSYRFNGFGGMGDPDHYEVEAYKQNGNTYTVYANFLSITEQESLPAGAVEGKDYFVVDDGEYTNYFTYEYTVKVVAAIVDGEVQFHSWDKADRLASTAGYVKPGDTVADSKPSSSSAPSSSAPSSSAPSGSEEISSDTASEEEKTMVVVAETTTAKLETEENVFPENTVVKVEEIKTEAVSETVKTAAKKVAEKFVAYEITATSNNVTVQPNGKVKATFNIPDGYDLGKVAVYYVADNGDTEAIPSTVDKASKTVVAELSHFSTYVVAEKIVADSDSIPTDGADEKGAPWGLIIGIIVVVAALGGAAVWYFLFYKKKAAAE